MYVGGKVVESRDMGVRESLGLGDKTIATHTRNYDYTNKKGEGETIV